MTKYYVLSHQVDWVGHAYNHLDAALRALSEQTGRKLYPLILVNQRGFSLGIPYPDDVVYDTTQLLQQLGILEGENDAESSF
jgi:pimeloyl-ACP methyl ester carboxylesterase